MDWNFVGFMIFVVGGLLLLVGFPPDFVIYGGMICFGLWSLIALIGCLCEPDEEYVGDPSSVYGNYPPTSTSSPFSDLSKATDAQLQGLSHLLRHQAPNNKIRDAVKEEIRKREPL